MDLIDAIPQAMNRILRDCPPIIHVKGPDFWLRPGGMGQPAGALHIRLACTNPDIAHKYIADC